MSREALRIEALRDYKILDTEPHPAFDAVTKAAALAFDVPMALVSLVDENRQWFKSKVGLDACETPRDISFCTHAIKGVDAFIVEDALEDERFKDNPLVVGEPHIRFYAGMPLIDGDGFALGTLCIIDKKPRQLDLREVELLELLAACALNALTAHHQGDLLKRAERLITQLKSPTRVA